MWNQSDFTVISLAQGGYKRLRRFFFRKVLRPKNEPIWVKIHHMSGFKDRQTDRQTDLEIRTNIDLLAEKDIKIYIYIVWPSKKLTFKRKHLEITPHYPSEGRRQGSCAIFWGLYYTIYALIACICSLLWILYHMAGRH